MARAMPPSVLVTDIHAPHLYRRIGLPMWTLYDHPTDMPEHYVLRLWDGMTCEAHAAIFVADTLEGIHEQINAIPGRFIELSPSPADDPKIIAVFL